MIWQSWVSAGQTHRCSGKPQSLAAFFSFPPHKTPKTILPGCKLDLSAAGTMIVLLCLLLSALASSIAIGAAAYVLATREAWHQDLQERIDLRKEFDASLHKMVGEHNKLVVQIADTADQVSNMTLRSAMAGVKKS